MTKEPSAEQNCQHTHYMPRGTSINIIRFDLFVFVFLTLDFIFFFIILYVLLFIYFYRIVLLKLLQCKDFFHHANKGI